MKKLALATAILAACASSNVVAQDAPPYENWVGGFVQSHNADNDKPEPLGGFESGKGVGAEVGFRFDPEWAVRFELSKIAYDNNGVGGNEGGVQLGADVLYFLKDDLAYFFGGFKEQSLDESYRVANVGIGKHWELNDNWRVITEAALSRDFGELFVEQHYKLGLAYVFGTNTAGSSTVQPDSDGDGVYDAVDRCASTPAGVAVDATGCALDLDGDGVVNSIDQCPGTPNGVVVDARGCELKDSDGDGVSDAIDQCANTPSSDSVDARGCSLFEDVEVFVELDLLFANNSSTVQDTDAEMILEFVDFMKRYPNTTASIEGHTSSVGDAAYNQVLSQRRAESVRNLLINTYGIAANRLTAVGFGETRLKFTENNAQSHRLNRRIEARVTATVEEKVTR